MIVRYYPRTLWAFLAQIGSTQLPELSLVGLWEAERVREGLIEVWAMLVAESMLEDVEQW